MILVTGGCFQGKTSYACETFGIEKEETADGALCPAEELYRTRLLYHFHEYIRRMMKTGQDFSMERLKRENPEVVLVTNERDTGWCRWTVLTGNTGRRPGGYAVRLQKRPHRYIGWSAGSER